MKNHMFSVGLALLALLWLLVACNSESETSGQPAGAEQIALNGSDDCLGTFVTRELDHITTNAYEPVVEYDSNGAGLAINDLDGDGDMDIVMANLAGRNSLFWNQGNLEFQREEFSHGSSRAAAIVDVDADGALDIVFTSRVGSLIYWRNVGDADEFGFERVPLVGIQEKAYAMAWADLDKDGDLDVVTGSYDTALEKELRDSFMFGDGAGVFVFTNDGTGQFTSERLADASQALTILILDVNQDGWDDVVVGNDFASVRDQIWLGSQSGSWESAEPFDTTSENTMSFDLGDVNNDGTFEIFAADMHPFKTDAETAAAWDPVMELMMAGHVPVEGDPQIMSNVLQTRDENGNFNNEATDMGVDSTGWSWSTKFGDLDQDGFVDLYSVNGMVSAATFSHLPNYTLVEENQALRNDGTGHFVRMPEWGLNGTAGGRGMSMADLDNDGDLDIVVNNLLSPAYLLENDLCGGESLLVELRWPDSENPFAIGSVVTLESSTGSYTRNVRVVSGYLSGDPTQLHFGFPEGSELEKLTITWPDGTTTSITDPESNQLLQIARR